MSAAAMRVGWCPGALRPMMSGDGLIVRVRPRGAALTTGQAIGIAAAARRHGNGLLDLTARANLQIRGGSEAALPALTLALDALGLVDADAGAEARRNVIASPMMGLDPSSAFDIRPAVAALEARLAADAGLADLPSKFGFAVSDGGALPLDGVPADVRFDALPGGRFAVRLDGDDRAACAAGASACDAADLPAVALRLARAFASAAARDPDLRRMGDLVAAAGAAAILSRAGLDGGALDAPPPIPRAAPPAVGIRPAAPASGSVALGVAAPFGRLDAAGLDALARAAARAGAGELRVTPWRALLVPGLDLAGAERLSIVCAEAGLIVDPADPRLRVAACAGAPGCRRGTTPVLADAATLAEAVARTGAAARPGTGIVLHVAGCAKGCAHPRAAPWTLVADGGRYGLVTGGGAAGAPGAVGLDVAAAARLIGLAAGGERRP